MIPGAARISTVRRASMALTTSFPTARTGKRAGPERQQMSPVGPVDGATAEDGFTLLEIVCVLAIIAGLAAIILPALPRGTPRARLEAYAIEAATMLRTDRAAAIRRHVAVATDISATSRSIRSGATGKFIRLPDDVRF